MAAGGRLRGSATPQPHLPAGSRRYKTPAPAGCRPSVGEPPGLPSGGSARVYRRPSRRRIQFGCQAAGPARRQAFCSAGFQPACVGQRASLAHRKNVRPAGRRIGRWPSGGAPGGVLRGRARPPAPAGGDAGATGVPAQLHPPAGMPAVQKSCTSGIEAPARQAGPLVALASGRRVHFGCQAAGPARRRPLVALQAITHDRGSRRHAGSVTWCRDCRRPSPRWPKP